MKKRNVKVVDCKASPKPPYQVFLEIPDEGNGMPSIVLRNVDDREFYPYPANLVKINGAIVEDLNGWHIADAIASSRVDSTKMDSAKAGLIKAFRLIDDVCNVGNELASESAMALVESAREALKNTADCMQINIED